MQNAQALRVAGDKVTRALQEHETGCYKMERQEFEILLFFLKAPCPSPRQEVGAETDVSIDQLSNTRDDNAPNALHTMLNTQEQ